MLGAILKDFPSINYISRSCITAVMFVLFQYHVSFFVGLLLNARDILTSNYFNCSSFLCFHGNERLVIDEYYRQVLPGGNLKLKLHFLLVDTNIELSQLINFHNCYACICFSFSHPYFWS